MQSYQRVVVGTDGSSTSYRALERAATLARDSGAELLIVCAYRRDDPEVAKAASQELGDDAVNVLGAGGADSRLERARDHIRDTGPASVDTVAVEGDPSDVLVHVVEERGADVLVVGNVGLNSLSGRLLGSVPSAVGRRSPVDVVIAHTTS